jgi:hypothetical protein
MQGRCRRAGGISGRAGALGPGTPSPAPICREQFAREVRAVIAEDIVDSAYRALIRLARIRQVVRIAWILMTKPGWPPSGQGQHRATFFLSMTVPKAVGLTGTFVNIEAIQ